MTSRDWDLSDTQLRWLVPASNTLDNPIDQLAIVSVVGVFALVIFFVGNLAA